MSEEQAERRERGEDDDQPAAGAAALTGTTEADEAPSGLRPEEDTRWTDFTGSNRTITSGDLHPR